MAEPILRDVIALHPQVLFVGINPSLRSAEVGHHFASPGNPFWKLLYAAGLIPIQLGCEDDYRLAEFGMALTNLCQRASRAASELSSAEIEAGKRTLRQEDSPPSAQTRGLCRRKHLPPIVPGQHEQGPRCPNLKSFTAPASSCFPIQAGATQPFRVSTTNWCGSGASRNPWSRKNHANLALACKSFEPRAAPLDGVHIDPVIQMRPPKKRKSAAAPMASRARFRVGGSGTAAR